MVLREILDSKSSSVFIVSFLFHKNTSSQGNAIEHVTYASIHIPNTSVLTPRHRRENDEEGQVWRKETLKNNGWFIAYSESYLGHTFEGPRFSALLILELIKFSHPLFCFSFAMQLETQRWQAEWCTSEQWFFLCCVKELSTVSLVSAATGLRDTPGWGFFILPLALLIQTFSTSFLMTTTQISLVWPTELEAFPPGMHIQRGLRAFL